MKSYNTFKPLLKNRILKWVLIGFVVIFSLKFFKNFLKDLPIIGSLATMIDKMTQFVDNTFGKISDLGGTLLTPLVGSGATESELRSINEALSKYTKVINGERVFFFTNYTGNLKDKYPLLFETLKGAMRGYVSETKLNAFLNSFEYKSDFAGFSLWFKIKYGYDLWDFLTTHSFPLNPSLMFWAILSDKGQFEFLNRINKMK